MFFVIRDHIGQTPLKNLRNTLTQDLTKIWASLSKPPGLEKSKIEDYFDFAFVALPHKVLQPEKFVTEVQRLSNRFHEGYRDPKRAALQADDDSAGVFLSEYHRRIPADGFPTYASNVWEQIESNKDLDLPTQQELLAQFRCDEIAREVIIAFDTAIAPLETRLAESVSSGQPKLLPDLGIAMRTARENTLKDFETEASRYHKKVYGLKREELLEKIDSRLRSLYQGQLTAAHKIGITNFSEAVSDAVRQGQKRGSIYDFAQIVDGEKKRALSLFEKEGKSLVIEGASWSDYRQEMKLYQKELSEASARLRKDEMRRLATRVERWVKSRLDERVGLEFNNLGQGRQANSESEKASSHKSSEKDLWDNIWKLFEETVEHAESRFTDRARGFDASPEEVEVGLWRLRRKSWAALRSKLNEEMMEGNILLKLRENFEDKFRYDAEGVPRIWRPTDDIESVYTKARTLTLTLIPIIAYFRLSSTSTHPPLDEWLGEPPSSITPADEEDLTPINGIDTHDAGATLDDEMTLLSEAKATDLATRFKKTADGVYMEAKRSAIGGITQVPLYFYGLLLALGWNEIMAVLRNPVYFIFLILLGIGAYVTYTLNLWGPMIRMADAASKQAVEVGKERLREFLESQEGSGGGRRAQLAHEGRRRLDGDKAVGESGGREDADEDADI